MHKEDAASNLRRAIETFAQEFMRHYFTGKSFSWVSGEELGVYEVVGYHISLEDMYIAIDRQATKAQLLQYLDSKTLDSEPYKDLRMWLNINRLDD